MIVDTPNGNKEIVCDCGCIDFVKYKNEIRDIMILHSIVNNYKCTECGQEIQFPISWIVRNKKSQGN